MSVIYTPPTYNAVELVISDTAYTPPTNNQVTVNLLVVTEPIPIVQNDFFLF